LRDRREGEFPKQARGNKSVAANGKKPTTLRDFLESFRQNLAWHMSEGRDVWQAIDEIERLAYAAKPGTELA
jgi:hypothetical protein